MVRKKNRIVVIVVCILIICTASLTAGDLTAIKLPRPDTDGGKPLLQVIASRITTRQFSSRKPSDQLLSNLLWAASGKVPDAVSAATARTPSAMGWNNVDVYVATPNGIYLYDREAHILSPIRSGDFRSVTALQPDVAEAPIILVYVANYRTDLMTFDPAVGGYVPAAREAKVYYSDLSTCFIAQNVYLFCASEGLATVFRSSIDRKAIASAMQLRPNQAVTHVQSVGYAQQ